jgi:nicotinamide mononucleotide (NMN) deamidase PncC
MTEEVIRRIHASGQAGVIVVTGGGATAISQLLAVPGGSRTLLEASVPYSSAALAAWLRRRPESYCSDETALAMAAVALERARTLAAAENTTTSTPAVASSSLFGLSCTASLVSDRPKRGEHRAYVAAHTHRGTASFTLDLEKGARDRSAEESLVGELILHALAVTCGVQNPMALSLRPGEEVKVEQVPAEPWLVKLLEARRGVVWSLPEGTFESRLSSALWPEPTVLSAPLPQRGVLCGSFNPLHAGHRQLRDVAAARLNGPVYYELSLRNVEKPPLDFLTLERRRRQFTEEPLALTSAPTFAEKAQALPGTTFVVGLDTAERIVDPRYYNGSTTERDLALAKIRGQGCRFLVAGRVEDDKTFRTLEQCPLPASANGLFQSIPESEFRVDLSSTELRRGTGSQEE